MDVPLWHQSPPGHHQPHYCQPHWCLTVTTEFQQFQPNWFDMYLLPDLERNSFKLNKRFAFSQDWPGLESVPPGPDEGMAFGVMYCEIDLVV